MTTPDDSSPEDTSARSSWMAFATMGMSVAGCVAVGVILGIWADSTLHTAPILLFVGLLSCSWRIRGLADSAILVSQGS